MRKHITSTVTIVSVVLILPAIAWASGTFVESDVTVLRSHVGDSSPGDNFGWVGASLGDLDRDGVDEYAITAITDPEGGPFAGRAYLYSGADGSTIKTIDGQGGELLGYSMDSAGDVDADGTADYVIGAPGFGPNPPPNTPVVFGRVVVISGSDHSVIHEFTPETPSRMGTAVAGAGDIDGDGHDDVLVGSEDASSSKTQAGQVTLFSGSTGTEMWSRDGAHAWDLLGSAADGVGDLDGDGVRDVVVGAYGAVGRNGGAAGFSGRGLAYVLSGLDGSIIHTLRPRGDAVNFGRFFARGADDFDGDGVKDVFVADYAAGRGSTSGTGAAYIFSGSSGNLLLALDGSTTGEGLGPGRGISDVNGDGTPDLLLGAWTSSEGAQGAGLARIYSGADGSILRTMTSTTANEAVGVDALGIGDVDADGLGDYLLTGFGIAYVIAGG